MFCWNGENDDRMMKEEKRCEAVDVEEQMYQETMPEWSKTFPRGLCRDEIWVGPGEVDLWMHLSGGYPSMSDTKCPVCGADDYENRGSKEISVTDIPYMGRAVSWHVNVTELRCLECGRESFAPDMSFLRSGRPYRTERFEEFVLFLASCTSSECAAEILDYMGVEISGDTVNSIVKRYREEKDWMIYPMTDHFRTNSLHGLSPAEKHEFAMNLGFFMNEAIMSTEKLERLPEMLRLFEQVFMKKENRPDMVNSKKLRMAGMSIWAQNEGAKRTDEDFYHG